jgi:toxic protein SymE
LEITLKRQLMVFSCGIICIKILLIVFSWQEIIVVEQEGNFQQSGQRQLKVYQKYIPRSYYGHVIFPEIRLCGKWLRDMGFDCGQSVTVRHEKNKIIITVDNQKIDIDNNI